MDRNALARATEATSAPTPGYLYADIAKNAATSPQTSVEICRYLTRRLATKSNPNVKHKCLRVIAKVAQSPVNRGMFQRAVVQDHEAVAAIKACLNFRGPPDAARGDQPYEQVRAAAKECLDAVYSDAPSSTAGAGGMMGGGGGSMQGIGGGGGGIGGAYGQPVAGGGGGYGAPGGGAPSMGPPGSAPAGAHPHATRRMEGIGSSPHPGTYAPSPGVGGVSKEQIKSMVATAAEGFKGIINDPLARNVPGGPPAGGGGSYGGPQNYGNPPGRSELSAATNGQWTMASNRGANAVGAAPQFAHAAAPGSTSGIATANRGVGGSWGAGGAAPSASGMGIGGGVGGAGLASPHAAAPAMGSGTAGASASDGSYERNLVLELCPPGGMKAEPPLEKLVAFLRAIPSLDADLVCPVLLDCLEDGQPWIIKAKALCVIEKTILTADEHGLDAYSAFFHACADEIQPLAVHNRSAIHNPARRVMKALGLDAAYSTGAPPIRANRAAAAAPAVAEAPNLLDFDEPAAAAAAPATAAPVPDMLGGNDPTAAPTAPESAPPPAPAAGGDMFGGLTTKDKPAPAPVPPAAAPVAPAPAASSGSDMFGDMQVKSSTSVETPQENGIAAAAAAPAAAGSAFGFMNGSAPAAASAAAPTPAPAPAPAPVAAPAPAPAPVAADDSSFDPLLSLSAPSEPTAEEKVAKTQAQIAQMQAMQYQQQMMMMQQQMAQMQMGMAGGGAYPGGAQPPRPATHAANGASAGVNANVMSAHNSTATKGFSFLDNASGEAQAAQKKKNAAFNFVMDDMKKG